MPRPINHQLVILQKLTQTKTESPDGVQGFTGTVCGTVETQSVKQWGPLNTTWSPGPMFLQKHGSYPLQSSFFFFSLNNFYVYFYSTRFLFSLLGRSFETRRSRKSALHQTKLCFCPFEDMILSICNQVLVKVCLHPLTLSAVDNARRALETQSLNKLSAYLAST